MAEALQSCPTAQFHCFHNICAIVGGYADLKFMTPVLPLIPEISVHPCDPRGNKMSVGHVLHNFHSSLMKWTVRLM